MRKLVWVFIVLLPFGGGRAHAQSAAPKWDVAATAAWLAAKPHEDDERYGNDWYSDARYGVSIGRYWSENLKTEVEYATSGEGSTYRQEFRTVPGNPAPFPISVESLHRLEQASVRMVWQFGKNQWVHPYISGGVLGDRERQRVYIPEQYQYVNGRINDPVVLVPAVKSEPAIEYRVGLTAGAGAKVYMSPNAFFNAGVIGTYSKPAGTISFLAGFGIDF
jgi:opacity protein-like surface antigen